MQRILAIIPDSGLDVIPEADSLYQLGYEITFVPTPITRDRLFAFAQRREHGIIHFAGHADNSGLQLDRGETIDAAGLVQLARAAHAELVFLNGCETAEIGQVLVDDHVPAAICTLSRIENQVAKETARLFYQQLAETHDIRTAYNRSKPPMKGGYSLFRNGAVSSELLAPVLTEIAKLNDMVAENVREHGEFRQSLGELLRCSQALNDIRTWGLRVFAAACLVVTGINLLFMAIRGGP